MQHGMGMVIVILSTLFFTANLSYSIEVTVTGEGINRQDAINNASRAAVEQVTGVYIKSLTEVKNAELIIDKISSASAGYLKRYDLVEEGFDRASKIYRVKIKASIDEAGLKSALDEFLKDPRAKRTFQDIKFDEKRIVVLYVPRTGMALSYRSKPIATLMNMIQDRLAHHAFRVFLQDELARIRERTAIAITDEKTAIELARQESADAIVTVSFSSDNKSDGSSFSIIHFILLLKAYDPTTGELFANVHEVYKSVAREDSFGIDNAIERLASKVGSVAVDNLTAKIVERFSSTRAKFVYLIFRNVSASVQDEIEDIVEGIGWKYKIIKQTGNYLEMELFSEADLVSIRKKMRNAIRDAKLNLSTTEAIGSRIIFDGMVKE
jgi:hypothetical protein